MVAVRKPANEEIRSVEWIHVQAKNGEKFSAPVVNGYMPEIGSAPNAQQRVFTYESKASFAEYRKEYNRDGYIAYGDSFCAVGCWRGRLLWSRLPVIRDCSYAC